MSHKDAGPETPAQTAAREWWTQRLATRAATCGWGRDKNGQFFSEFARDATAAWDAAQASAVPGEVAIERAAQAILSIANPACVNEVAAVAFAEVALGTLTLESEQAPLEVAQSILAVYRAFGKEPFKQAMYEEGSITLTQWAIALAWARSQVEGKSG